MTATFDAAAYDSLYLEHDVHYERPTRSPYCPLFRRVAQIVAEQRLRRVLEVGCGSPLRTYLRRLRWAGDEPKRFLRMLGVRQFEWHGGWFIVVGRRRRGK